MKRHAYSVWALAVLLAVLPAFAAAPQPLEKGPYLQNLSSNGVTVCWVTATETPEGEQYVYHQAPVTGLKPATEYGYYAGDRGELKGVFRTAPVEAERFRFAVYGDSRTGHSAHRSVVSAISRANPRFVVNTGDLVNNGRRLEDWGHFFTLTHELMMRVPYWPVLGNHERNSRHYYDHFALPGTERYYSFDYGTCHFVMLDSDDLILEKEKDQEVPAEVGEKYRQARKSYWGKQLRWLENDLETHKNADFIFAFFHHPLYSSTERDSRREEQRVARERFEPLLKRYNVSAVFHGHDHFYERNVVGGTQCVVTGGGGAPLYPFGDPLLTSVRREGAHHFVRADVDGKTAKFTVLTPDDRVIDTFHINARR